MADDMDFGQPVEEGDKVVVTIEDMGSKGDGIARIEGFVIFVPETEIGETVEIEIDTVGSKFAFGKVVERDVEKSERYEKEEVEEEPEEETGEDYGMEEVEEDYEKEEVEEEPEEDPYYQ